MDSPRLLAPSMPGTPRSPGFNSKSPTIKRILQESRELSVAPDPTLSAAPLDSNLFEWHFTIVGPPSSPYEDGLYHGRIILPPTYPLRPPSFRFTTPSGRFEINREICLSISGHHEETWQPAWGIRTALCAIRAFMANEAKGQLGGLDMTTDARRAMAKESRSWCCLGCGGRSNEEHISESEQLWRDAHPDEADGPAAAPSQAIPEELRLAYKEDLPRAEATPRLPPERATAAATPPTPSSDRKLPTSRLAQSRPAASESLQITTARSPTKTVTAAAALAGASKSSNIAVRPASRTTSGPAFSLSSWVDMAIIAVASALAFLVLKRILI